METNKIIFISLFAKNFYSGQLIHQPRIATFHFYPTRSYF